MTTTATRSATTRIRVAWALVAAAIAVSVVTGAVLQLAFLVVARGLENPTGLYQLIGALGLLLGLLLPAALAVAAVCLLPAAVPRRAAAAVVMGLAILVPGLSSVLGAVIASAGGVAAFLTLSAVLELVGAVGVLAAWLAVRGRPGRTWWVLALPAAAVLVALVLNLATRNLGGDTVSIVLNVLLQLLLVASVVGGAWLAALLGRERRPAY